jgi:hypothetical protein
MGLDKDAVTSILASFPVEIIQNVLFEGLLTCKTTYSAGHLLLVASSVNRAWRCASQSPSLWILLGQRVSIHFSLDTRTLIMSEAMNRCWRCFHYTETRSAMYNRFMCYSCEMEESMDEHQRVLLSPNRSYCALM